MLRHIMVLMIVLFMVMVNINEILAQTPPLVSKTEIQHGNPITAFAFLPDSYLLAVASIGIKGDVITDVITVYNVKSRQVVTAFQPKGVLPLPEEYSIESLAFSPDSKILAVGSRKALGRKFVGKIELWNLNSKQNIATLGENSAVVRWLCFSSDGRILVSADNGNELQRIPPTIKLWDVEKKEGIYTVNDYGGRLISLLPHDILAYEASDGSIKLLGINERKHIGTIQVPGWRVGILKNGSIVASWSEGELRLWSVEQKEIIARFPATQKSGASPHFVFSPDDKILAIVAYEDEWTKFFDIEKGTLILTLLETPWLSFARFSPDGKLFCMFDKEEYKFILWDVSSLGASGGVTEPLGKAVMPQGKLAVTWGKIKAN